MRLGNKFKTASLNEDGVTIYIKGVFKRFIPWGEGGGSTEDAEARAMARDAKNTANNAQVTANNAEVSADAAKGAAYEALAKAADAVVRHPDGKQVIYSTYPLVFGEGVDDLESMEMRCSDNTAHLRMRNPRITYPIITEMNSQHGDADYSNSFRIYKEGDTSNDHYEDIVFIGTGDLNYGTLNRITDKSGRRVGELTNYVLADGPEGGELIGIEGLFTQAKKDGSGYAVNRRTVIDFRRQVIRVYRDDTLLNTIDLATLGK